MIGLKTIKRILFDRQLPAGTLLGGRFELVRLIGKGGYGLVYEANDLMKQDTCVVKQARPSRYKKGQANPFDDEMKYLTRLEALPYFPIVRASFVESGHFFLAEDYIVGKTFETLVFEEGKKYSNAEAFAVLSELLTVVEQIHEHQIVHRDLRLPNIIVTERGLKVIDFGLASELNETDEEGELSKHIPLEKYYMRKRVPQSDLYALGHTTLFLLYSSYKPTTKKEKPWEEELKLPQEAVAVLRRLLQIDEPFSFAAEAKSAVCQLRRSL
ncbi:protein kinase [Bacillus tianshenii]|nr:protein kinase [Bacillus tianshenii]